MVGPEPVAGWGVLQQTIVAARRKAQSSFFIINFYLLKKCSVKDNLK
jgi:hypothetical protein